MFDIGFIELLVCGVIALLVLGPERLPTAARTAGRWIGRTRRMVSQFTSELDRQLKAEELREQLRKAGDVGLEDVEKNVRGALDEAKKYEHMVLSDDAVRPPRPAPATRKETPSGGSASGDSVRGVEQSPQTGRAAPDSSSSTPENRS